MLPRSTNSRMDREAARGKQSGRTVEIQRLIGRSLRAALDLKALGENTLMIDCDVIQADGGTRTASISGACVAVVDALNKFQRKNTLNADPFAPHDCRGFGRRPGVDSRLSTLITRRTARQTVI